MVLTEEEARKQICPFIRYCINEDAVMQHRAQPLYVQQSCQASDCKMAWRWVGHERGYCGIAGKPT